MKNCQGRTMVVISDIDQEIIARPLLTDEQLRFFKWLQNGEFFDSCYIFQILDDDVEPEVI